MGECFSIDNKSFPNLVGFLLNYFVFGDLENNMDLWKLASSLPLPSFSVIKQPEDF
jgi:hypothetical protein